MWRGNLFQARWGVKGLFSCGHFETQAIRDEAQVRQTAQHVIRRSAHYVSAVGLRWLTVPLTMKSRVSEAAAYFLTSAQPQPHESLESCCVRSARPILDQRRASREQ